MEPHVFTSPDAIREFVLAGNATITIKSVPTGAHYTYKIRKAPKARAGAVPVYFVSLLTGPDNETDYRYVGLIPTDKTDTFRVSGRVVLSPGVRAFAWFWKAVQGTSIPATLEVRHEGRCGRCGRLLTVPESIDRGIGPECQRYIEQAAMRAA